MQGGKDLKPTEVNDMGKLIFDAEKKNKENFRK